jgi:hypothetical protein
MSMTVDELQNLAADLGYMILEGGTLTQARTSILAMAVEFKTLRSRA